LLSSGKTGPCVGPGPKNFPLGSGPSQFAHPLAGDGPAPQVGNSVMPRPAFRAFAFEPERIESMHRAFGAVCARLQLSVGSGDCVTELVARKIIELARAGDHHPDRLTARVLAEFGVGNDGSLWRH
jgi:hypothetical protein